MFIVYCFVALLFFIGVCAFYRLYCIFNPKETVIICRDDQFYGVVLNIFSELSEPVKSHLRGITIEVLDNVSEYSELKVKSGEVRLGLHIRYRFGPDKIELYKNNLSLAADKSGNSLEQCVRKTLFHEIGHHFGYNHKKLNSLGL